MSQPVRSAEPLQNESVTTIHLLRTICIPACQCRLTQVEVTGGTRGEMVLFNPVEDIMKSSGATPALCEISVGRDGKVVLSIENHTLDIC